MEYVMTEKEKVVAPNPGVEIPGEAEESSLSPRETQELELKEQAGSLGWRPKDEFDGDPSDWVSAREFIARQSFFDKIKTQSSEIRSLRGDIQAMSQHFAQMRDVEYKRALADLKSERKEAIQAGDSDKAESMSDQIVEIETQRKEAVKPTNKTPVGNEEFEAFKQRNSWYNTDTALTQKANVLGMGYANLNPQASPEEVLQYVENEMKTVTVKKTVAPASPEGGGIKTTSRARSGGKLTEADLNDMQKKMMKTFVQRGALTKEQYLDQLSLAEGNK